jgi:hypothetical protein
MLMMSLRKTPLQLFLLSAIVTVFIANIPAPFKERGHISRYLLPLPII